MKLNKFFKKVQPRASDGKYTEVYTKQTHLTFLQKVYRVTAVVVVIAGSIGFIHSVVYGVNTISGKTAFVKTYFQKTEAKEVITIADVVNLPKGDRREEVKALHSKLANDIYNDTKFKEGTDKMINALIEERKGTAAVQALTVMSIQMDTTFSDLEESFK